MGTQASRLHRPFAILLTACAYLLPGMAGAGMFDDDEARARIEALRKQVESGQRVADERFGRIDDRLKAIESGMPDRRALVDLAGQIELLRGELSKIRGQSEVLANQIETSDRRQKDLYVDIDTRLRKLEQGQEQATPKPAPIDVSETRVYEAALNQFKMGSYSLAISAFQGFLVTYPTSQLASSAQYWVGNAYYALRDFKNAIITQQKLIAVWPDSQKAPDAMLNIASSQEALGDRRGALKTLDELTRKFPGSPAAESAKQRMTQGAKR
jgi:tol-pal system protein YbgF